MGTLLEAHGTDEQKKKYITGLATGTVLPAAAFTEPDSGSDSASMIMKATKTDGGYLLNGAKACCTYANRANVLMVLARTNPDTSLRHKGLSMFFVEKESAEKIVHPNIKGEPIPTVGYHGMRSFNLAFEDVFVPEDRYLPGAKGLGGPFSCLNRARYGIAWGSLGSAQACFDAAKKYSLERIQFDHPIAAFQLIQMKLATMLREITKGQLLAYHLGRKIDEDNWIPEFVSLAKMNNVDIALDIARVARDIHGANGVTSEYPIMRHMNNLESVKTYEGTHDIHNLILARHITGIQSFTRNLK